MATSKTQSNTVNQSISDTFEHGKLIRRSITKGDLSFSMAYLSDCGTFDGDVMKKDGDSYTVLYSSMETVGEEWAQLPYPELNELRDTLAKVWEKEINTWRLTHTEKDDFDDLLTKKN